MENIFTELKSSVKNWWTYEILGALFIVMSLLVFSRPLSAYVGLVIYFVLTFIFAGILRITFSITNRETIRGWGWYLAGGVFDLLIGLILASRMDLATVILPFYVGFFLLFSSGFAIAKAFDAKAFGDMNWGYLLFAGFLGLIFSILILSNPVLGAGSLVIWTGAAFMAIGAFYIILGLRFRKIKNTGNFFRDTSHA